MNLQIIMRGFESFVVTIFYGYNIFARRFSVSSEFFNELPLAEIFPMAGVVNEGSQN